MSGVARAPVGSLLVESRFGGRTIAAVAQRAGVGRGTVYPRWPAGESLIVAALAERVGGTIAPQAGSRREDLLTTMRCAIER